MTATIGMAVFLGGALVSLATSWVLVSRLQLPLASSGGSASRALAASMAGAKCAPDRRPATMTPNGTSSDRRAAL
jgi:hypothetical protein